MPKVKCASIDCKWNSESNMCTYKGKILLNDSYYHTVNEGMQHFHRCMTYEKDEYYAELEQKFTELQKKEM